MYLFHRVLAFIVLFAAGTGLAWAQSDSRTFNVKIQITSVCDIQTAPTDVDFGSVNSTQTAINSTGTLNVRCTSGTPYNIALNAGSGSGATVTTRTMGSADASNTARVPYALYRNAARTQNWGSTIGIDTQAGTGNGAVQPITVYGQVASTNYPAGSYSDVVTATVTW
ncbi:spore coat U domain-containing protein [uncultured Xanthomonas sp.]|uniref:Csu type fimbrial protein n=1 Tax=uncultured Xanthomonas sp. TaxID=152831 RepID=UPI0025D1D0D0|nr:spore coat U domain-containing protein [uncultured Xanthomonas sp.]